MTVWVFRSLPFRSGVRQNELVRSLGRGERWKETGGKRPLFSGFQLRINTLK
jgi:hypothetical protein